MNFKLNRIEETDIFYLAAINAPCQGETLISGTFEEVFAYATQLKDDGADVGTGDYKEVNDADLTNVSTAKWFLIDLNNLFQTTDLTVIQQTGVLMIVRTNGVDSYSLPTGRYSTTGTLTEIFTRIHTYVTDLLA